MHLKLEYKIFLRLLYTNDKFHAVSNFTFLTPHSKISDVGASITYNYSLDNIPMLGKLQNV